MTKFTNNELVEKFNKLKENVQDTATINPGDTLKFVLHSYKPISDDELNFVSSVKLETPAAMKKYLETFDASSTDLCYFFGIELTTKPTLVNGIQEISSREFLDHDDNCVEILHNYYAESHGDL